MKFEDLQQQKLIHFIGIGGIGMSALALILEQFKISTQGSDLSENYMIDRLRKKNIKCFIGHDETNISQDVSLIVKTSIIKDNNPEIIAAKQKNIPIITRANLLAIIMQKYKGITIAGTHGKTTTTAIISVLLDIAGFDPTVINGGLINYFDSNSKIGNGKYLVAESDESDASFVELPTSIGVVTNIEPEHLEFSGYLGSFEKQKAYFERYINQIPDDGICVLCLDDLEVEKIYNKLKITKKNLVTYSIKKPANLVATNIKSDISGIQFDVEFEDGSKISNIQIPIYGVHNISNSLSAIAIARFIGISDEMIKKSLSKFNGVKRRFTKVGEYKKSPIIDDYGHHPSEIKATLGAARTIVKNNKIICVFQPHKFTRVRDLLDDFANCFFDADVVIVTDIYSAGQAPIEGINQDRIVNEIKKAGHKLVLKLEKESDLAKIIKENLQEKDMIFLTGAGNITYIAQNLSKELNNL